MYQATSLKNAWKLKKDKNIRKYKKFLKKAWHKMLRNGADKQKYKGNELYW